MAYDIGPKIGISGENEFRKAINDLNTSFKTLGTEMSVVTSAFDKNDKSSKALTSQNEVLNKQIDTQKLKLVQLNSGLDQSTEKYGAADKVTQGWQQAVNNATAELNKMDAELKSNNKSIDLQNSNWTKLGKSLDDIGSKMKTVGAGFSSVGKSMTMGLTAPILGAVAGLGAMVMKSSATADELQKLSDVTGLSAERLQELKYAGSALGVELDTITGAQSKLTKAMNAAAEGKNGPNAQAKAFKELGISVRDHSGNLRDSKKVMEEAFTALGKMGNETERDSLAMQLFGKSGMALNPIIKAGGAELARLTDEARKNGAVMSNESVAGLDKFGDSLDAMKLSISGAVGEAASKLMPTFEKLLPIIQDKIVPAIGKFAQTIANLIISFTTLDPGTQKLILGFGAFLLVIGPIVTVIGSIVTAVGGIATAFGAVSGAIAAAGGVLAVLTGPIAITIAAVAGLIAIGVLLYKNWDTVSAFLSSTWQNIVNAFNTSINAIVGFFQGLWNGITGIFGSIGNWFSNIFTVAWNGIMGAFSAVGAFFQGIWAAITGVFTSVWNWLQTWGLTILAVLFWPFSLALGLIIANWNTISAFFTGIWNAIVTIFTPVVQFFTSVFQGAWNGIVFIFSVVGKWFSDIFTAAWNGIKLVFSVCAAFFQGVWDGIVRIFSVVGTWFSGIFQAAWNAIVIAFNFYKKFFTDIWNGIVAIFTPIVKWFGGVFADAWDGVKKAFSTVGGFFQGVWNTITGLFGSIGTTIGNAIGGAFKTVVNSIIGFAESTINGFIRAINGAIGLINHIPGVNVPILHELSIPRMDVGTRYLPYDTLLMGHQGEMIVPRSENPYANSGGGTMPKGVTINLNVGTLVGTNGMNEFANIISQKLAGQYGLATGGDY